MLHLLLCESQSTTNSEQPTENVSRPRPAPLLLLGLLVIGSVDVGDEVHLVQLDKLGALVELPRHVHGEHDGKLNVEAHEADGVEAGAEARPSLDQDEKAVEEDGCPRSVGVRPVLEGEEVSSALALEAGAESDRGDADGDPAELV